MSVYQVLLVAIAVGLTLAGLVWVSTKNLWGSVAAIVASVVVGLVIAWPDNPEVAQSVPQQPPSTAQANRVPYTQPVARSLGEFDPFRPAELSDGGYASSESCNECHEDQYHSWHHSYHRTMTQAATPEAVAGNFDNVHLTARGRDYHLQQVGDVCWVKMNEPDFPVSPDSVIEVPIVMTTGSHHMQVYWYPTGVARTLGQLPIVYLKDTKQWVPRTASFLRPADTPITSELGRWNQTCSQCHATHSRKRLRGDRIFDTYVTEFGIACEACHGPAEQHIAFHRAKNPLGVDSIVNPVDLSPQKSSQVCGQCHAVRDFREELRVISEKGHSFRPGADLNETHEIWKRDSQSVHDFLESKNLPGGMETARRSVYWDDGMVRVSGREYNGMLDTACHVQGELSCLSCHTMHQSEADRRDVKDWANDQLSIDGLGDAACTQCHKSDQYGTQHTHHPVESSGSRCYNCHMPHTTYGLLTAMRSHTISSPDLGRDLSARRPNACNLCHLDQTLQWTADRLQEWYKLPAPELDQERQEVAAAVLWLLKGDAGLRALSVWSMGWSEAQQASGNDWIAPLVARTMNDPYYAVRLIAHRTMKTLPNFGEFQLDVLSSAEKRAAVIGEAIRQWQDRHLSQSPNARILIGDEGSLVERIEQLMRERDNAIVDIVE